MRRLFGLIALCLCLSPSPSQAIAQQAPDTHPVAPRPSSTELVYSALDASLKFFATLKQHVAADFRDPAMREDAIKKLKATSTQMDELIAANDRLIQDIRDNKTEVNLLDGGLADPNLDEIDGLLHIVQYNLRAVANMVPDSDRAALAPRIDRTQIGGASRALEIANIYHHRSASRDQVLSEAKQASALAYEMRDNIAVLITTLSRMNAEH